MVDYKALEDTYEVPVYPKRGIVLVKGRGAKVWDTDGKEYIDCTAGVGVANAGHCNPAITAAIKQQLDQLVTCYSIFPNDKRALYLQKLLSVAPKGLTRAFLCNSGSETVEAAIKFARATTGKRGIIALMRGFHGKTLGSLGAMWNKEYKDPFLLNDPDFHHVPANNLEKLKEEINETTAAVMFELVQGEGGVRPLEKAYVKAVRKLCTEKKVLLIIDEVQTGFGRTGKLFCCEHYGITPDILCCAKGIANGLPMGACIVNDLIQVPKKSHTTTFGGSPLVCAAALATLEYFEKEKLPEKAAALGTYALKKLQALKNDKIREVRGLGLMLGIELKEPAGSYIQKLMEKGVLALLAGNTVVRFLPPLVITKEELDRAVAALEEVLS